MLILSRYTGQRIRVTSPQGSELWISCDDQGVYIDTIPPQDVPWVGKLPTTLDGQPIIIAHIGTSGRHRIQHGIGIAAPDDCLILREELIDRPRP